MTKQRIEELVNFFYSSNSIHDVPARIGLYMGQFIGYDFEDKDQLRDFLHLLNTSKNLKDDLNNFIDKIR